ncbi:unnamed protein product, partial [Scytosiphon promiscuus]
RSASLRSRDGAGSGCVVDRRDQGGRGAGAVGAGSEDSVEGKTVGIGERGGGGGGGSGGTVPDKVAGDEVREGRRKGKSGEGVRRFGIATDERASVGIAPMSGAHLPSPSPRLGKIGPSGSRRQQDGDSSSAISLRPTDGTERAGVLRLSSPPIIPRIPRPGDGGRKSGRGSAGAGAGSQPRSTMAAAMKTFFAKEAGATPSSSSGARHDADRCRSFDAATDDSRNAPGSYCSTVDELFSAGARGQRKLATEADGGWYSATCEERCPREVEDPTLKRMARRGRYASTGGSATSGSREDVDVLFRGGVGWSG